MSGEPRAADLSSEYRPADIETPKAFFDAVKNFRTRCWPTAWRPRHRRVLTAVQGYYANLGIHLEQSIHHATAGGSEALQMALTCILDEGDEILIPEPFYPNYNTFCQCHRRRDPAYPHNSEEGYLRRPGANRALINEHTRAILVTTLATPLAWSFPGGDA